MRSRLMRACSLALTLAIAATLSAESLEQKVDFWVLDTAARGDTEFLVMLRSQADLRGAKKLSKKAEKGAFVNDSLRSHAASTQRPVLDLLSERGAAHRSYWVANMIWVRGSRSLVEELAAREDVFHIYANPTVHFDGPVSSAPAPDVPAIPDTVEWGVAMVKAPEVWALGYNGQNVVVGGQDTGYDWTHPALKLKYRGNGLVPNHNYNWHDAIHSGGGVCGADSPEPCDDHFHGTHTMGTMVGESGVNQIGVAPGAKWIGCRNMDQGNGTPETYSECFQWFIAPTDLQDQNPDPSKSPHVINNSWGCPPSEGCNDPAILQTVVENTRAAGIEVVVSAGNAGSGCESVLDPAAIYDASFSIGATDSGDQIAGFSSRGPVTIDGSGRMKPDVSAPGVNVRSSVPGGGYGLLSGTSMAGPHVVGVVALLLSQNPGLIGNPDAIEPTLTGSAVPRTSTQTCGGVPGSAIPNNTYGWGRVDALAAVQGNADLAVSQSGAPDPTIPTSPVTYTITVTNLGPLSANGVTVSEGMTLLATVDSAVSSQGSCTLLAHGADCSLGTMSNGAIATVTVVGALPVVGTLTSNALATATSFDPNESNNLAQTPTTVEPCPPAAPTLTAPGSVPASTGGLSASVSSGPGHTVDWTLSGGTITEGQGSNAITFSSGDPGTTMALSAVDSILGCAAPEVGQVISVDFLDVPPIHLFHDDVNIIARNGVTAGCGNGNYCPDASVTRAQMAVFLLKGKYGAGHVPPPATGTVFGDVPQGSFGADWIEELYSLEVTGGCGNGNYCPDALVTRAQMAVLLLKAAEDPGYAPPAATGTVFGDVLVGDFAADWIEELASRGVTAGCGGGNYCPGSPNTRGQMAVFLVRTFGL